MTVCSSPDNDAVIDGLQLGRFFLAAESSLWATDSGVQEWERTVRDCLGLSVNCRDGGASPSAWARFHQVRPACGRTRKKGFGAERRGAFRTARVA